MAQTQLFTAKITEGEFVLLVSSQMLALSSKPNNAVICARGSKRPMTRLELIWVHRLPVMVCV